MLEGILGSKVEGTGKIYKKGNFIIRGITIVDKFKKYVLAKQVSRFEEATYRYITVISTLTNTRICAGKRE
jgi:hypothetical protein